MPEQNYAWNQPIRGGIDYDPTPRGIPYDSTSVIFGAKQTQGGIDAWLKKTYPQLFSFSDANQATNAGAIGDLGGDWANVDRWDSQIATSAQKVQAETGVYVPPNVVKAIMKIESNGEMLPANGAGAVGLMQLTGSTMGQYDMARAATDPEYNIYAGITELALRYKDGKAQFDAYNAANPNSKKSFDWSNAITGFFAGHYEPTGANDGNNSDYQYRDTFNKYVAALGAGTSSAGKAAAPGTAQFNAIWGGYDAPITQEFGMTDFAANSDYAKTAYAYTSEYSTNGQVIGHAGVDVGVSYGTQLYAPQAGQVILAGGTGYYCDSDGNGCGNGVGELAIQYANGDQLILGHMSQITVKVGDTIQPGQFVGYSGSENGAHVHVEYRKAVGVCTNGYDGTCTNSGWQAVDPRLAITGIFSGTYGTGGSTSGPVLAAGPSDWNTFMMNASLGLPIKGGASAGGFHDWLTNKMGVGGTANAFSEQGSSDPTRWIFNKPPSSTAGGAGGGGPTQQ